MTKPASVMCMGPCAAAVIDTRANPLDRNGNGDSQSEHRGGGRLIRSSGLWVVEVNAAYFPTLRTLPFISFHWIPFSTWFLFGLSLSTRDNVTRIAYWD